MKNPLVYLSHPHKVTGIRDLTGGRKKALLVVFCDSENATFAKGLVHARGSVNTSPSYRLQIQELLKQMVFLPLASPFILSLFTSPQIYPSRDTFSRYLRSQGSLMLLSPIIRTFTPTAQRNECHLGYVFELLDKKFMSKLFESLKSSLDYRKSEWFQKDFDEYKFLRIHKSNRHRNGYEGKMEFKSETLDSFLLLC